MPGKTKNEEKLRSGLDLGSEILIPTHVQGPNPDKLGHQPLAGINALESLETRLADSIQLAAAEYVPEAIRTLGTFAKGESVNKIDPSAPTVRQSARDIIEFAGGRPETRAPEVAASGNQTNIFVMRFGEDKAIPLDIALEAEKLGNPLAEAEHLKRKAQSKQDFKDEPERRRKSIAREYAVDGEEPDEDDGGKAA